MQCPTPANLQALAYPIMQPAVAQLFYLEQGSPQLYLAAVGQELVPAGRFAFGQVATTIKQLYPGDVCLGLVRLASERRGGAALRTPVVLFRSVRRHMQH